MTIRFSHALMRTGRFNSPSGITDDTHWHVGIEMNAAEFNSFDAAMYDAAREAEAWLKKHKQPMNGTLVFKQALIEMSQWDDDDRPTPIYYFDFICLRPAKFDPRYDEDNQPK